MAQHFAAQIDATVAQLQASSHACLNGLAANLAQANAAFRQVVDFVLVHTKTAPNNVFAGSVLYLKLAGLVVSAWHSARAALAAQAQLDAGNNDVVFLNGKIDTSAFYIQSLLPQAQAWAQAVCEAGDLTGNFDVAQF